MVVVVVDRRHLSFCVERSLALDNADKDESEFSAPLSVMWAEFAVFLYSPYQAYLNSKQTILTTAFHTSSHSQTSSRLSVTNREIVKCNLGNAGIARASLPLRSYRFWEREHECKRRIKHFNNRSIGASDRSIIDSTTSISVLISIRVRSYASTSAIRPPISTRVKVASLLP
jgi:hypothetical protein